MADIFEDRGIFTITRLRAENVAFLSGAVSSSGPLPSPIALARGPLLIGPSTNPDADSRIGFGVTVPAAADVAWVLISANFFVLRGGVASSALTGIFLSTFGDILDIDNTRGPVFAQGALLAGVPGAAGDFHTMQVATDPNQLKQLWVPLDPASTTGGWTMLLELLVGATAPLADEIQVDMSQVLLVGYPANAWNTGALWNGVTYRGS